MLVSIIFFNECFTLFQFATSSKVPSAPSSACPYRPFSCYTSSQCPGRSQAGRKDPVFILKFFIWRGAETNKI